MNLAEPPASGRGGDVIGTPDLPVKGAPCRPLEVVVARPGLCHSFVPSISAPGSDRLVRVPGDYDTVSSRRPCFTSAMLTRPELRESPRPVRPLTPPSRSGRVLRGGGASPVMVQRTHPFLMVPWLRGCHSPGHTERRSGRRCPRRGAPGSARADRELGQEPRPVRASSYFPAQN